MPFQSLVVASINGILNTFLYHSPALKTASQQLTGKVLRISLKEISISLVLIFDKHHLDMQSAWEGEVDCSITAHMSVLSKLCKRQQLTTVIHSDVLKIEGDLQVAKNFFTLIDLAEFDLTELLAPYISDIAAEGITTIIRKGLTFFAKGIQRQKRCIANFFTEEWRIGPGLLEVKEFTEETTAIYYEVETFAKRIKKLEGK